MLLAPIFTPLQVYPKNGPQRPGLSLLTLGANGHWFAVTLDETANDPYVHCLGGVIRDITPIDDFEGWCLTQSATRQCTAQGVAWSRVRVLANGGEIVVEGLCNDEPLTVRGETFDSHVFDYYWRIHYAGQTWVYPSFDTAVRAFKQLQRSPNFGGQKP